MAKRVAFDSFSLREKVAGGRMRVKTLALQTRLALGDRLRR